MRSTWEFWAATVAVSCLFGRAAHALEQGRRNAVGLSLAGGIRSQRDEGFNNTRYAGPLGSFALSYTRFGEVDRHHVELGGGGGLGHNRYARPLLWIDLGLRYDYRRVVVGETVRLWLGASAGGGPGLYQFRAEDSDHVRWLTLYDFAANAMIDWRTRDSKGRTHSLEAAIELPLVGIVSQSPIVVTYNNDKPDLGYLLGRAHSSPKFAALHDVQAVRLDLGWRLRLTPVLEQRVGYRPSYVHATAVAPFAAWTHPLVYRLDFRIGP